MRLRLGERLRGAAIAPLRWLLPRSRKARIALALVGALLVLALLAPALQVLLHGVDLLLRVVEPLLATTLGRITLAGVVVACLAAGVWWLFRDGWRRLRDNAAVGRHLAALAALVDDDFARARPLLRRVAVRRGAPARCPWVAADASLKLAREALARDRAEEALHWLERVPEAGLPLELQRSLCQLRAVAWRRQGKALPAQQQAELDKACQRFPDDAVLAEELLALAELGGDVAAIAKAHARCVANANASARPIAVARQVAWLQAHAAAQLAGGDLAAVRAAAKTLGALDPAGVARDLLLGDAYAAEGRHEKALATWGATRSWEALERAAALLERHPDVVEPARLLALLPMQGALLLVARMLARRGEAAAAERAARLAVAALGQTPTTLRVLAEIAAALGRGDDAERLLAAQRSLLLEDREDGAGGGT